MQAISLRLPDPMFLELVLRAKASAISQTEIIRSALAHYFQVAAPAKPMSAADACLVRMVELVPQSAVFTLDAISIFTAKMRTMSSRPSFQTGDSNRSHPLLAVAYSGGADSTALLIETHQQFPNQTIAFHVHHGLQAAADSFVSHCQAFCEARQIPLLVAYVKAKHASGESPEDAARGARYKALIDLAKAHGVVESGGRVLLGQHADDQVETLLLALSRGAGLGGLSAMPASFERGGVQFERPMLHRSAAEIRESLRHSGTAFIEDPTNSDKTFTRNKIRLDVLPALQAAFPEYAATFLRSISHIAEANDLLTNLAGIDLAQVGSPPRIKDLQLLAVNRQANAIRFWLKSEHGVIPSTAQLDELLKQVAACQTRGHQIRLKVAYGFVIRSDGQRGEALNYHG